MKKDNHCSSLGQLKSPLFLMIFLIFAIFFFHPPLRAQKKQENSNPTQISKESQIVEDLLHIYLTPPKMRDAFERIQIEGQSLKIYYLDPNQSQQALKLCTAMRWLINGRLKQSSGISKVFEQLPQIQKASLIFFKFQNNLNLGLDGKYTQTKKIKPTLKIEISRDKIRNFEQTGLKQALQDDQQCLNQADVFLDQYWVEGL